MRKYSFFSAEQTLEALNTSPITGLSERRAQSGLAQYGRNTLHKQKKSNVFALFFAQFKDVMIILLIAAAATSAVIAFLSGDSSDLTDTFIIVFIIFLNAIVGTVQQYRADKALEQLKKLSVCKAKVLREGKQQLLDSELLTVGDIVLLEEGDVVPADCRILEANGAFVDESALTGESLPVEKDAAQLYDKSTPLGSTKNALFSSTFLVRGRAKAVVTGVGMDTEIGAIAGMLGETAPQPTPLEKSLTTLGKIISAFVLCVTAIVFVVGLIAKTSGLLEGFMSAVAIAVAAIPEGLPAVVTIIMAMGVQKMSKQKVIIRKLKAVETLGSCNVICTDKTGTLTCNRMRVDSVFVQDQTSLWQCMAACNNVAKQSGVGDPTELALVRYVEEQGFTAQCKRLCEVPFSSERKRMTVVADFGKGAKSYTKGAADVLIKRCKYVQTEAGVKPLTPQHIADLTAWIEEKSANALRVLGFAYHEGQDTCEQNLTFIGLCGLSDPLKEGVKEAVAVCEGAGVRTVMITGDHALTALAIGNQLGIAQTMEQVVTGEQLDALGKKERIAAVCGGRVFARVTPKHKNLIVKILQGQGNVVAMTGDGVNDAPSIKSADIGIAMGLSGTDVTKNASDMVIADDNFATIAGAVREGRRIAANIKKTIQFFLATNLAEVLAILIATLCFFRYDFMSSTQLLWLNLITDSFPVLALGRESQDFGVMNRPPQRTEKALFSKSSVISMLFFGFYITAVCVGLYATALQVWGNGVATTVTFLTISFCELFHAFNVRSERQSAFKGFLSNKTLLITVALGVLLNVLLCVTPLSGVFGLSALNLLQWIIVFACSLSVIAVGEGYKAVVRAYSRTKCKKTGKLIKAKA